MRLTEETRINHMRIRAAGGGIDRLSARLRMQNLLSHAELRPRGLPASAIVCIRLLRDPRPGTLRLRQTDMRPPRVWEEAVNALIDRLARKAIRPAFGPVPADAEAILFMDRAELLACLGRDWCEGSIAAKWWWKSLFKNPETAGTIIQAWLETPEDNPGAFQILAEQGKVASFASRLSKNEALALIRGMTQKFGLTNLQDALAGQFGIAEKNRADPEISEEIEAQLSTLDASDIAGGSNVSAISEARQSFKNEGCVDPPWLRHVPEGVFATLTQEQQALLGVGLMLNRAPAEIRKKSFADAVYHWKTGTTAATAVVPADSTPLQKRMPGSRTALEEQESSAGADGKHGHMEIRSGSPRPVPLFPVAHADAPSGPLAHPHSVARVSSKAEVAYVIPSEEKEAKDGSLIDEHQHSLRREDCRVDRASGVGSGDMIVRKMPLEKQPQAVNQTQPDLRSEAVIETELGGLFYLINLGLFLGLYGDFTTPRTPGIDLDIWDFITLLGRDFADNIAVNDPVWPLLAKLAGRRGEDAPGSGFEPPDEWRMPPAWLDAFPRDGIWRWNMAEGRLKVVHESGFLVLDVAGTDEEIEAQLERESLAYKTTAAVTLEPGPVSSDGEKDAPLEKWVRRLVSYIQVRLLLALGHATGEKPSAVLFRHRARVHVTETHLDVHFYLADLPIEIRIAGLDRDPGWVPAAGRYVKFHYE